MAKQVNFEPEQHLIPNDVSPHRSWLNKTKLSGLAELEWNKLQGKNNPKTILQELAQNHRFKTAEGKFVPFTEELVGLKPSTCRSR